MQIVRIQLRGFLNPTDLNLMEMNFPDFRFGPLLGYEGRSFIEN